MQRQGTASTNQPPGDPGAALTIRAAEPSDEPVVVELIRQYYSYDGIHFDARRVGEGLIRLLGDKTLGQVWIAHLGHEIAGYAIVTFGFDLEFDGRQATLTDLYLVPAHRRKGIGSALLAHVERECGRAGVGVLELQVQRENHGACDFYRALGYRPHDRVPMSKALCGGVDETAASLHQPGSKDPPNIKTRTLVP